MRIEIRGDNVNVPRHTRELIDKKCRVALHRLVARISDVRIIVRDENGPRRGIDLTCSVGVRMRGGAELRAEATDALVSVAADLALDRVARAAHRLLARRREYARDNVRFALAD